MGAQQLLAEIDIPEAEGQQSPADVEAPSTVAEVRVAAGDLGVGCGLMNVRAGICTCFCHGRLLAWRCWKQRAESHLLSPVRPTLGPRQQIQVTCSLQFKGSNSKMSVGLNSGGNQVQGSGYWQD